MQSTVVPELEIREDINAFAAAVLPVPGLPTMRMHAFSIPWMSSPKDASDERVATADSFSMKPPKICGWYFCHQAASDGLGRRGHCTALWTQTFLQKRKRRVGIPMCRENPPTYPPPGRSATVSLIDACELPCYDILGNNRALLKL